MAKPVTLSYGGNKKIKIMNFPKEENSLIKDYLSKLDLQQKEKMTEEITGEMNDVAFSIKHNKDDGKYYLVEVRYNATTKEAEVVGMEECVGHPDAVSRFKTKIMQHRLFG